MLPTFPQHHRYAEDIRSLSKPAAMTEADYAPEQEFIAKLSAIPGVSQVETQEYTCQPL